MYPLHMRNNPASKIYVFKEGGHVPQKVFYSAAKAKDFVLGRRVYGESWEISDV